jgi:hypothetical protein
VASDQEFYFVWVQLVFGHLTGLSREFDLQNAVLISSVIAGNPFLGSER